MKLWQLFTLETCKRSKKSTMNQPQNAESTQRKTGHHSSRIVQKTRCLDIQLVVRLLWCPRFVSFWLTRRTATWSLGIVFFPRLSKTWGSSGGTAPPQPEVRKKQRSLLERARIAPRPLESPPSVITLNNLKDKWEKRNETLRSFPRQKGFVPHVESSFFWLTDGKIPETIHTELGYEGQCRAMRHKLSCTCLKVSSGSTWTLNDHKALSTTLYVDGMMTALANNQICHNSILRWQILLHADSRSSCVCVSKNEKYQIP